jgi:hypothetical protein
MTRETFQGRLYDDAPRKNQGTEAIQGFSARCV